MSENNLLKDKLGSTNNQVDVFMKEMTGLLDVNELNAVINMEVESDEDDGHVGTVGGPDLEMDRMFEVEYDEHRPHAGTGGSSKMKSRPGGSGGQGQLFGNRP